MQTKYYQSLSNEGFHRIAYSEFGTRGEQPPIVCVHGLTRNRRDFDPLASHLANHDRHVFCPDIAGRGDSDWFQDAQNYGQAQYLKDMATLIARIDCEQLDWIGTSMGGIMGMMLAAQKNSPIRKLVMNDIGPEMPLTAIKSRKRNYKGKTPVFESRAIALKYFKKVYADFGELTTEEWESITNSSIKEKDGKFVLRVDANVINRPPLGKFLLKLLTQPKVALQGICFNIDWWSLWDNIQCPVLVIHGEKSDLLLSSTIDKMQATHNSVECLRVPNVGHAPSLFDKNHQEYICNWLR